MGLLKDAILFVPAYVGAGVAVWGLWTWKRQLQGSDQYQVAKRLLKATLEYRNAIQEARNPFGLAETEAGGPENERQRMALRWERKFEPIGRTRTSLEAELLEATVLWGGDIRGQFDPLFSLEGELFVMALEQVDAVGADGEPELNVAARRTARKAILYHRQGDDFSARLDRAVEVVEAMLRPRIGRGNAA